ncbi:M20/M25/M40 family metallo-hydrolase [Novosphingobium sp.]|uniref:M20/M25/M40 family metallo-hydrolase n=1 Tax=Novosphingobium sp. TaxID=1874826 RepID=UPI0038BBA4B2
MKSNRIATIASGTGMAALAALVIGTAPAQAAAAYGATPATEAAALDLAMKSIAIRSVIGEGNRTADVAALYRDRLVAAGWAAGDVAITPFEDTAYLIATWPGSDPTLKPLVLSGHMDVVEAKRADWQRDPFGPVVEDGLLYGRGATDMKFDGAMLVTALADLRKQGFRPRRTIVLEFSGDEETTMKTSSVIAEKLKNAELVLNVDGGGGAFDEASGKPLYWTWGGAEKTYADFQLEVRNPGGHSSAPHPDNAIVQLAQALEKIGAYQFAAEQNAITREWFAKAAAYQPDPAKAAAMRAFAVNKDDAAAVALLRSDPSLVGKTGTTCVPTMLAGGHALNALPQRATANINCRIFPGHSRAEVIAELQKVIAAPVVTISDVSQGSVETGPSPVRADFVGAATKAIRAAWGKDLPVIATQDSGASDSAYFRVNGVPSYNASPTFAKHSESFSHGLNERVRLSNVKPALTYYFSIIPDLAK